LSGQGSLEKLYKGLKGLKMKYFENKQIETELLDSKNFTEDEKQMLVVDNMQEKIKIMDGIETRLKEFDGMLSQYHIHEV
jgi:hypothetical protein